MKPRDAFGVAMRIVGLLMSLTGTYWLGIALIHLRKRPGIRRR